MILCTRIFFGTCHALFMDRVKRARLFCHFYYGFQIILIWILLRGRSFTLKQLLNINSSNMVLKQIVIFVIQKWCDISHTANKNLFGQVSHSIKNFWKSTELRFFVNFYKFSITSIRLRDFVLNLQTFDLQSLL